MDLDTTDDSTLVPDRKASLTRIYADVSAFY